MNLYNYVKLVSAKDMRGSLKLLRALGLKLRA